MGIYWLFWKLNYINQCWFLDVIVDMVSPMSNQCATHYASKSATLLIHFSKLGLWISITEAIRYVSRYNAQRCDAFTIHWSPCRYDAIRFTPVYDAVRFNNDLILHYTIRCDTMRYNAIRCDSTRCKELRSSHMFSYIICTILLSSLFPCEGCIHIPVYLIVFYYRVPPGFFKLNLRLFKTFLIPPRMKFKANFTAILAKVWRI